MAHETLHPTLSQVEAAKLLVEMLDEDGETVDDKLRELAATEPSDLADTSGERMHTESAGRPLYPIKLSQYRKWAESSVAPWAALVSPLLHRDMDISDVRLDDDQLMIVRAPTPGDDVSASENADLVAEELLLAMTDQIGPEQLSAEALRHVVLGEINGQPSVFGIDFATPAVRLAFQRLAARKESDAP